jgi:osmotically-inducible protein OsmY
MGAGAALPVCRREEYTGGPVQGIFADVAKMSMSEKHYTLALAVILAAALPGCAVYSKCGFHGCPGDAKITADVRTLIATYPALEAPNSVRVQTMDRVVYLNGQVDTELERSTAESAARSVAGVTRVVNSISLSNPGR